MCLLSVKNGYVTLKVENATSVTVWKAQRGFSYGAADFSYQKSNGGGRLIFHEPHNGTDPKLPTKPVSISMYTKNGYEISSETGVDFNRHLNEPAVSPSSKDYAGKKAVLGVSEGLRWLKGFKEFRDNTMFVAQRDQLLPKAVHLVNWGIQEGKIPSEFHNDWALAAMVQYILNGVTGFEKTNPTIHNALFTLAADLYDNREEILEQPLKNGKPSKITIGDNLFIQSGVSNEAPNFLKPVTTSVPVPSETKIGKSQNQPKNTSYFEQQ
jgi:hypothetical protein